MTPTYDPKATLPLGAFAHGDRIQLVVPKTVLDLGAVLAVSLTVVGCVELHRN